MCLQKTENAGSQTAPTLEVWSFGKAFSSHISEAKEVLLDSGLKTNLCLPFLEGR